jgi:hypothetical protein
MTERDAAHRLTLPSSALEGMRVTDQATRVVPAGWYQDPALSDQVRWWNGLAWTEHVRDKPTATVSPASHDVIQTTATESEQSKADRVAAARQLEREFGIGTSENEIITGATALGYGLETSSAAPEARASAAGSSAAGSSAAGSGSPAGSTQNPAAQRAAAERRTAAQTTTGTAWLLGLIPLLTFVLALAAAYLYFYVAALPLVFAVAFLLPYLLGLLWALGDRRTLAARGIESPHPAWALLGGITYLIARRRRIVGSGPVALFVVAGVLAVAVVAGTTLSGQLRPLFAALSIQSAVSEHYLSTGQAVSVSCPPFVAATVAGTLYTCDATTALGTHRQIWISIDDAAGHFSYSMSL